MTHHSRSRQGSWHIDRRTALRGLGAAICLPVLDVMELPNAHAATTAKPPVRLGYLYFPNGSATGSWKPQAVGPNGQLQKLNKWMEPLEPLKHQIVIPHNVWTPRGNGHVAGPATWLTGGGWDAENVDVGGPSVDQIAAAEIGRGTMFPSFQFSMKGEGNMANSLPRNNMSWVTARLPAAREEEPRLIFDRMFLTEKGSSLDRSVLDRTRESTKELHRKVSRADQRKLDEYLEAIRAVERRLDFADQQSRRSGQSKALRNAMVRPPAGIPKDHQEYMRTMLDLMVLGFWADATRVCSFMLDHGQSNRYFNFIPNVKGTWHALSHWKNASGKTQDDDGMTSWDSVESKKDMYNRVTMWHHTQFAYVLKRMAAIPDGDGTLLDNSVLLYGSSMADGADHRAVDLPLIIGGGGGGAVKRGRYIRHEQRVSMSRLHLAMLQAAGVNKEQFSEALSPISLAR